MPISSEYRLPGVYTTETTGPRLSTQAGGNAVVAFVGPSLGKRTASQRVVMRGTEWAEVLNGGVVKDSFRAVSASTGLELVEGVDFEVQVDVDGNAKVRRLLTQLNVDDAESGVEVERVFYSAQPTFSLLEDQESGLVEDAYVIVGTVSVTDLDLSAPSMLSGDGVEEQDEGSGTVMTEGQDYVVDYHTGELSVKVGTRIENGHKLRIEFSKTKCEPVELVGEAAYPLTHKYVSKDGVSYKAARQLRAAPDDQYNEVEPPVTMVLVSGEWGGNQYGDCPGIAGQYYVEGADYVVDYDNGRVSRTASSRIPSFSQGENNLMYASFAYCGVKDGETVVLTYDYKPDDYDRAHWFSSYNELMDYYGQPWDGQTGDVTSPLSVAAYIANRNGMGGCYAVSVPGSVDVSGSGSSTTYTLASWGEAFDSLTVIDGIDIVVPLSGDPSVWDLAKSHKNTMADNEDERVCIIGADGTSQEVGSEQMVSYASSLSDEDMWLVGPSTFRFRNPITGVVETVPGWYMAAAVAGYEASVPQYTPLTQKYMNGLYSANEYATKATKRNQCANGVMYVDEYNQQMRVLHGRTTSTASIVEQETNIVLTKYYIIKTMRRNFAAGYIGQALTSGTLLNIKATAQSVLSSLVSSNYMTSYNSLSVEQDASNPTQVNISFEYVPTYSLNYIYISFSIDQSSTIAAE